MKTGVSPWIKQLNTARQIQRLRDDVTTDVAIVGAGIAGISTAFFLLRNTSKKVVIIEKNRLAHGATGHNAGQIVSYFERAFSELAKDFGLDMATAGQKDIDASWGLLDIMYREAGLDIPFSRFLGYSGFSTEEQVLHELENILQKTKGGIDTPPLYIANDVDWLKNIPKKYDGLYIAEIRQKILQKLETGNDEYVAMTSAPKGCINSALFCQEVLAFLLKKYGAATDKNNKSAVNCDAGCTTIMGVSKAHASQPRFSIYEETPILKVVLKPHHVLLDADQHTVAASRVVLCTNGFENLTILNETGLSIDTKFHHDVEGKVGYMSGYLEKQNKPAMAMSYYTDVDSTIVDPYFYLTRRAYEHEGKKDFNLVCVGGPDISLEDRKEYIQDYDFPEEAQHQIDDFVKNTYETTPNKKIDYQFTWHGLMGYTPDRVRRIGPEPKNPVLMYNLGCNGVGILPSIFGGEKISKMIAGMKFPPSIFDPK